MTAPARPERPVRHETRALLRAHLAAASGYRHLTRHCPICHRLLRLAMETAVETSARAPRRAPGEPPQRRPWRRPWRPPRAPESPRGDPRGNTRTKVPPRHDQSRRVTHPGDGKLTARTECSH
ncbi:DUF6274 family protein [Streptomyces sp. G45]|uniref:DUF6274 family protein n=1 Tax=Streptomyces sp. G45 TaxID=3406627 RepID=UPI003C20F18E